MTTDEIVAHLTNHGVKPTANRITVARQLDRDNRPVSLIELTEAIETIDRSNIFRTLTLFRKHHLVHVIEDGSDSVKYEICRRENPCDLDDLHVHFYCEICHSTTCLDDIHIPVVKLPESYTPRTINYVVKGICPTCNGSASDQS